MTIVYPGGSFIRLPMRLTRDTMEQIIRRLDSHSLQELSQTCRLIRSCMSFHFSWLQRVYTASQTAPQSAWMNHFVLPRLVFTIYGNNQAQYNERVLCLTRNFPASYIRLLAKSTFPSKQLLMHASVQRALDTVYLHKVPIGLAWKLQALSEVQHLYLDKCMIGVSDFSPLYKLHTIGIQMCNKKQLVMPCVPVILAKSCHLILQDVSQHHRSPLLHWDIDYVIHSHQEMLPILTRVQHTLVLDANIYFQLNQYAVTGLSCTDLVIHQHSIWTFRELKLIDCNRLESLYISHLVVSASVSHSSFAQIRRLHIRFGAIHTNWSWAEAFPLLEDLKMLVQAYVDVDFCDMPRLQSLSYLSLNACQVRIHGNPCLVHLQLTRLCQTRVSDNPVLQSVQILVYPSETHQHHVSVISPQDMQPEFVTIDFFEEIPQRNLVFPTL